MARGGGKAAIVLCMDVGFAMSNSAPGEESPFEQAKKMMTMFVQRQVFAESKDEVSVVLFGTDGTENTLASGDQYQNITVQRHLMLPDFDLLEDIQNAIQPGSEQADFLDALVVCMDLLQKETIGKKYEKRHIEVFTDLSSPFSEDQLEIIIANLKKTGISLQFFLPFPVDDEEGSGDTGDGRHCDMYRNSFPRKGLTEQQKEGICMVRKLMFALEEEGGLDEIYTFRESLERLSMFKKIERRPMAWPCQLTIGSNLSIRIVAYKSLTEEKLKKSWTVVDAKTLKKEDVQKETVYCLNDDDETEVPKDDLVQGFRYGSDIVPFSKVDEEQMKYKTEAKCFSVLGFSRSSQIQRHHYMGNQVLKVFAAKDDEAAAVALSALIHALDELDVVAIVRYAYDRRSNPQVGVAFPCIKDAYECLIYVQLPYMEDLRQYMFSSLKNNKKYTPTEDQLSAVDFLIDSMSLVYEDDDGETTEDIFKTSKIPNPQFQRLYQCLQHKAFHPDQPLPPIEQHLLEMLETPQEVRERCQAPLEKIKALFPLKDAGKKKEQKTAQDVFKDNNEDGPSTKKANAENEEGSFSIANLAEGNVTTVGSINPAENFRVLVRQKNANFKEVSQQLVNRIEQFLETKGLQYYMKSINCIRVFREEAIKLSEVQCFNDFLQALKEKVEDKTLADFWEILIQDGISLITKDEAEGSSVTSDEAKKFLAPKEKPAEAPSVAGEDGDVDDLLDMM
ncbi:X-ray repair cross-complementing protein 5 isoform X1 [Gopherus flavomarginatus]|uniref:X-ray repair cross-complementing protein 5 isoform X1 n=1 Tax=Gopherus flavomarginatus TaxID=286002 RepID=UPI0021CBD337|nr:X-ray repair cross-complementing protein 5 isoform X1 [Gopherus flavomarginatus]